MFIPSCIYISLPLFLLSLSLNISSNLSDPISLVRIAQIFKSVFARSTLSSFIFWFSPFFLSSLSLTLSISLSLFLSISFMSFISSLFPLSLYHISFLFLSLPISSLSLSFSLSLSLSLSLSWSFDFLFIFFIPYCSPSTTNSFLISTATFYLFLPCRLLISVFLFYLFFQEVPISLWKYLFPLFPSRLYSKRP